MHSLIALFVINITVIYHENNTRIKDQFNGFFDHIVVICEKTFHMFIGVIHAHMVTLFFMNK